MHVIRDFMLFIGSISSIFDFLTFYALLRCFHASERLFHTGWFVESLATQTLVLFVIRTMGNPFRSRPSRSLMATTLLIVAIGLALPVTPMAALLGFTRLPGSYLMFLIVVTISYPALVDVAQNGSSRDAWDCERAHRLIAARATPQLRHVGNRGVSLRTRTSLG